MNRQEPVIDANFRKCRTLTDRVNLSWDEVLELAAAARTPATDAGSGQPRPLVLTEDERKAIAARLAPAVEEALRESLRNAVEMAASNAVTRIKADLERSVAAAIQQAVASEVRKIDLADIVRR